MGIDVSAEALYAVALDEKDRVQHAWAFGSQELDLLTESVGSAEAIAIDAPDRLSSGAHELDPDAKLGRKFRGGRCAEIDLGRRFGLWVPWVTPRSNPSSWMATGLRLYEGLRTAGMDPIEVYPHAAFQVLGGARLPKKTTIAGRRARIRLLRADGVNESTLDAWSHDGLDALVAALVARDFTKGTATSAGCGHDGSSIWLPSPLP